MGEKGPLRMPLLQKGDALLLELPLWISDL